MRGGTERFNSVKECGGYIELETFHGKLLHEGAIALNCGRGALEYLCEAKKVQKLYLPRFLCSSVPNLCKKIGVEFEYYPINKNFEPVFQQELGDGEWLYIVNFYGQLSNDYLSICKQKYGRIIVDNAQSYYQMPVPGVDTLYTCRKYFGVADGAFLHTDAQLERELPRMNPLNECTFYWDAMNAVPMSFMGNTLQTISCLQQSRSRKCLA